MMMKTDLLVIMLFIAAQACEIRGKEICLETQGIARIEISVSTQPSTKPSFAASDLMLFQSSDAGEGIHIYNPNIDIDQLRRQYNR